jgi:hypothetical protein
MSTNTKTAVPAVVDLSNDLPLTTAELHIVKPGTDTRTGWIWTMCGPAHPKTLAYQEQKQRERLHKEARIEQAQVNQKKYKAEEKDVVEANLEGVRWVVSRIESWNPVQIGNETIAFSDEAATKLLMKPEMGQYFAQAVDFLTAERSFMPRSEAP